MAASQELEILSVSLNRSEKAENGQGKDWEIATAAEADLEHLESSPSLAKNGWPDYGGRKRGRHSYDYYRVQC